jgi:hypothetical protein
MRAAGTMTLIAAVLFLSPGCVKQPDWIESTLVTVDVTGVWEGTAPSPTLTRGGVATRAYFDLEQEGPQVKGKFQLGFAPYGRFSGPLEGRVGGDVFHFRVIGGQGEISTGEVTVNGDEMEGTLTIPADIGGQTMRVLLRRSASPSRPPTQGP